jgi:hypothetical protein
MSNVRLELSLNATDTSVCLHQQGIIASDTLTSCAQMLTREGFIHCCQHLSDQLIMFSSVVYSTLRFSLWQNNNHLLHIFRWSKWWASNYLYAIYIHTHTCSLDVLNCTDTHLRWIFMSSPAFSHTHVESSQAHLHSHSPVLNLICCPTCSLSLSLTVYIV